MNNLFITVQSKEKGEFLVNKRCVEVVRRRKRLSGETTYYLVEVFFVNQQWNFGEVFDTPEARDAYYDALVQALNGH